MKIVYTENRFKSEDEYKKVCEIIKDMSISEGHDWLVEHGYMKDNRLKVKDLIKFLETLDPEANLCYGEQNGAMLGEGYWQHMVDSMLPMCIKTVKKDKEELKQFYVQDRMSEEDREIYTKKYLDAVEKDYKYVNDSDIIIKI